MRVKPKQWGRQLLNSFCSCEEKESKSAPNANHKVLEDMQLGPCLCTNSFIYCFSEPEALPGTGAGAGENTGSHCLMTCFLLVTAAPPQAHPMIYLSVLICFLWTEYKSYKDAKCCSLFPVQGLEDCKDPIDVGWINGLWSFLSSGRHSKILKWN